MPDLTTIIITTIHIIHNMFIGLHKILVLLIAVVRQKLTIINFKIQFFLF